MKKQLTTLALNVALPQGQAPDWVELLPAGVDVVGIDGRKWKNDQPQDIVAHFNELKAHNRELPFDFEHASELKAPNGDPAPAAAWGTDLVIRDGGAIWAKVEWTPKGREAVLNREYRYLSPALIYDRQSGRIVGISSVGLTNKPNLTLNALNRDQPAMMPDAHEASQHKETTMKKIYAKLGLAENATEDEALAAIGALQSNLAVANNRADNPSLDKFVPRPDFEAALNRATTAEQALTTHKQAALDAEIDTEVSAALKSGKITPATVDYHKANCRAEGGLGRFRDFVKAAPVIGDPSNLDTKSPDDQGTARNAEQAKIDAMFGNSADDLKKYGGAA